MNASTRFGRRWSLGATDGNASRKCTPEQLDEGSAERKKRAKKTTVSKAAQTAGPAFKIVANRAQSAPSSKGAPSNKGAPLPATELLDGLQMYVYLINTTVPFMSDCVLGYHASTFKSVPQKEICVYVSQSVLELML